MRYDSDNGAPDCTGRYIQEGDHIVVGSNSGIRVGKVVAVKSYECTDYRGIINGYTYSVTVMLKHPLTKRQTFPHDTMGAEKFWVVST